jgi:hypothetical protein
MEMQSSPTCKLARSPALYVETAVTLISMFTRPNGMSILLPPSLTKCQKSTRFQSNRDRLLRLPCKWLEVFCQPQCVGLQWSSSTSVCVMILSSNSEAELHVALRQRRYGDKRNVHLHPNAQNHKANKLHCRRDAFRSTDSDSEQRNKRSLFAGNGQNGKN